MRFIPKGPKHIHIKYNEHEAVIKGSLPKKARILVREWAEIYQNELLEMWDSQNFHKIKPLE